jgi:hypothetical protein
LWLVDAVTAENSIGRLLFPTPENLRGRAWHSTAPTACVEISWGTPQKSHDQLVKSVRAKWLRGVLIAAKERVGLVLKADPNNRAESYLQG